MGKHCLRPAVLFFLLFLIISGIVSSAYAADSENRTLKAFDGVKVSGPIKLYLSEGSSEAAKVTVEGIELEKIATEVTGNTLEVKPKPPVLAGSDVNIRVYVTYTKLRELRCTAGAELHSETVIRGDKFEVEVASSGSVYIQVDVTLLSSSVTSAGELTVSGKARDQESGINTGGTMHAFELICDNAYIKIGSGGSAEIYATELIEGSVKSAGSLEFKGDPRKQRVEKSSGGKIKEIL
jgi:hypothetical protein